MQALGDQTRLRILMLLSHGELRVDDLMRALDLPQSKVSRHLAYLKNASILKDRRQWNQIFYAVDTHESAVAEVVMPFVRSLLDGARETEADARRLRALPLFANRLDSPDDRRIKVLFICVHNSARSQMAEAFLNALAGDSFRAESAGIIPSSINPLVIAAMKEAGLDISRQRSKSVGDLGAENRAYDIVVTVCAESRLAACPVMRGEKRRFHWDIEDPSAIVGGVDERMAAIRIIRDRIKMHVERLIDIALTETTEKGESPWTRNA